MKSQFCLFLCSAIFLYTEAAMAAQPEPKRKPIKLLWVPLNRPATYQVIQKELSIDFLSPSEESASWEKPFLETIQAPVSWNQPLNPLVIEDKDFYVGDHLPENGEAPGPIPRVDPKSAQWFDEVAEKQAFPQVFMIGGHHVISEGWHNDPETGFLYMPTLLETLNDYPNAKKIFSSVKLAILWGCNTLTDLEPHGDEGEYLDSDEIKDAFSSEDPEQIQKMLGTAEKTNSLEFYKSRLASEYGPNSGQYEYTRDASKEVCIPGQYNNCPITNLERILPNSGLYDGEHRYDEPARMKLLFPNAYLILGFTSASPREEVRSALLERALQLTRQDLSQLKREQLADDFSEIHLERLKSLKNVLYAIIDEETSDEDRKLIIGLLRKNWTLATRDGNTKQTVIVKKMKHQTIKTVEVTYRPSGSITPAFPEIDGGKVFPVELEEKFPELKSLNGYYEKR